MNRDEMDCNDHFRSNEDQERFSAHPKENYWELPNSGIKFLGENEMELFRMMERNLKKFNLLTRPDVNDQKVKD